MCMVQNIQKLAKICRGCLVSRLCPALLWPPWTVARQAPLPMGFPRQEYCSGLPFPSPGDLPEPGMEPRSWALQDRLSPSQPCGKPRRGFCSEKCLFPRLLSVVQFLHQVENICSQVLWAHKENHKKCRLPLLQSPRQGGENTERKPLVSPEKTWQSGVPLRGAHLIS